MTAQDQMRSMLDQLMGTSRDDYLVLVHVIPGLNDDAPGDPNRNKVKFDDPRVCKSALLGCCPHDILSSTRMDLGECPKVHDLALKADYEIASANQDYFYDIDAMEHLETFISECDRKTELAKKRLKETQEELSEEAAQKAESIHMLGEQIGTQLARAEEVGAEGNVEESLKNMDQVEDLKKQKASAEIEYRNSMPASSYQQQKLRVCEVCSAYLGIHDNDRRLADHFGGKLHLGFIKIREHLDELRQSVQDRRLQREREREERRKERDRPPPVEDRKRRSRSQSREKRRSPPRRHRSRSDSRERRRHRSRSRDRRRHSRDRHHRSKSRSRSRSRRNRRSRSRSRTRKYRRSRSRSRSRRSRSRSRSKRSRNKHGGSADRSPRKESESATSNGENSLSKELELPD